jgi:NitT/TauT family transport system ATP-binding protein
MGRMISLDSVSFSYDNTSPVPIFTNFTWNVAQGETWAVLGPSGCGKTTLLYLLAGLRFPVSGEVRIDGVRLTRPRPHTGLILQDYGLLPWATVRQNIELGLRLRDFYGPDGKHAPSNTSTSSQDIDPWLERLGLSAIQEKYPSQISGGQRQRTAIARTLVLQPDLLLMDEPFASLDAPTRESLQELVLELWKEQKPTLVTITHTIEEAVILGQKILVLGTPPNSQAMVVENPSFNLPEHRNSQEYAGLCQNLRDRLKTE